VSIWIGVALLVAGATVDAANDNAPDEEQEFLARYAPAHVDGPGLALPEPMTRLYVDGAYARSADLSALPFIEGSGRNIRFNAGGSLRWRRFAFDGEITFSQITTLDITHLPLGEPIPQDRHQTATSIGDIRLGVNWTQPLLTDPLRLVAGFGLRGRLPTHTTIFQFHLIDGTVGKYVFPYYFHVEPTVIFAAAVGRFAFVMNQGVLLLTGPDGDFEKLHIVVPNLWFWTTHYALVCSPLTAFGFSIDLETDMQLGRVNEVDFLKLNDIFAAYLSPGIQLHIGPYRLDLATRVGLTRGAELFGVLQFAGTDTFTIRLGRRFN
jgi:hypothetical protein